MEPNLPEHEESPEKHHEFDEEWYEESADINTRAFAMTEDEWVEQEGGLINDKP